MTFPRSDFTKSYFSDKELDVLERYTGFRNDECPVCLGEGSYKYQDKTYQCEDDDYGHVALRLSKLYWLHGIPMEYQQLVWSEWPQQTGDKATFNLLNKYIENYQRSIINGVGMTFYSKGLGTGKTWAATAVLKELVKRGVDGWFAPFYQVAGYYDIYDQEEKAFKIKRVQESAVLVLDELRAPVSVAQKNFLAEKLEDLIRPRSGANLPTIITTNMTLDEIEDTYPRAFSVIYSKNHMIELTGSDARLDNKVWARQQESILNGEALPIT